MNDKPFDFYKYKKDYHKNDESDFDELFHFSSTKESIIESIKYDIIRLIENAENGATYLIPSQIKKIEESIESCYKEDLPLMDTDLNSSYKEKYYSLYFELFGGVQSLLSRLLNSHKKLETKYFAPLLSHFFMLVHDYKEELKIEMDKEKEIKDKE